MHEVTVRIELRISEQMREFLATEAHSRKLSFEGLIVSWIDERMRAQRDRTMRRSPR